MMCFAVQTPFKGFLLNAKADARCWKIFLRSVALLVLSGLVVACGGGSGKDDAHPSQSQPQELKFSTNDTVNVLIGDSFTNVATGQGSGLVSYMSTDTSVAQVDAKGKVTTLKKGVAIIRASIAADSSYADATAAYIVNAVLDAPTSLADSRLTLNVTHVSQETEQFPSIGQITSYLTADRFVEDGAENGIGRPFGTYTFKTHNVNEIILDETNEFDLVRTRLTFTEKTAGTFHRDYYDQSGNQVILTHDGNFYLDSMPFEIIPTDFTHRHLTLDFKTVNSSLVANISPIAGQAFNLLFLAANKVNFVAGNDDAWTGSFNLKQEGPFNLTISGNYDGNGHSYELKLVFNQFTFGSFSLNVDKGQLIAEGSFSLSYDFPYVHNPLKGQLIEGAKITSLNTGVTYPYSVYLPASYATANKQYPVVYIIDGQWASDLVYMMDDRAKEVILVLIEQGPDNRRMTDYAPVGAESYIKFLKQEFIPLIESRYAPNQERTFFGGSIGGSLGAILLSKEPVGTPYFKNYIIGDGTFWWYPEEALLAEEERYKASDSLPINLLLSTTRQGQITSVLQFYKRYSDRHYQGINIQYKEYQVQHAETAPLTFSDYMDMLY